MTAIEQTMADIARIRRAIDSIEGRLSPLAAKSRRRTKSADQRMNDIVAEGGRLARPFSPADIGRALNMSSPHVSVYLTKLVASGRVVRLVRGAYVIPGNQIAAE